MTLDQSDYTQLNSPTSGGDRMATKTDGVVKAQKVLPAFDNSAGTLVTAAAIDGQRFPVEPHSVTTFSEAIAAANGTIVTLANTDGFLSIGFRLTVPTGATVVFEGTFDNINWVAITLRQVGGDGFTQQATSDDDFIGSIAGLQAVRFRLTAGGSAAGTVAGTLFHMPCTLEGIEHGNPPHNIGVAIKRFHVNVTGAVSGQVLYTPSTGKRFFCTGYALGLNSNGTVVIFDETDAAANYLFSGETKNVTTTVFSNHSFSPVPFESSAADNEIKITTTSSIEVRGVITGYEA